MTSPGDIAGPPKGFPQVTSRSTHYRQRPAPSRGALPAPSQNRGFLQRPVKPLYYPQQRPAQFEQLEPKLCEPSSSPTREPSCFSLKEAPKQITILVNHNRLEGGTREERNGKVKVPPGEHQLHDIWTFWYLRFEKNFSWEHSQMEVADCYSVEQFWGIFDQLVPLTEAHHGCNYSLFKRGIRPIWEDPMNRYGGRFVFTITKEDRSYKHFADQMWLEFAMAVVGNILPDVSDQICGIIGGNRNNMIKIAVWTRDCQKLDDIKTIGRYFKEIAQYHIPVPYEAHMDSQLQRSNSKTLFKI